MMRDLISAFNAASHQRMKELGWHKLGGNEIFTRDLDEGFVAWLGLNRATRYHPLKITPVVGVRYEPLQLLLADLVGQDHSLAPTLSKPIGYLTPSNTFLQLEVAHADEAAGAAERLVELVEHYAVPFGQRFTDLDNLASAVRESSYIPSREQRRLLLPAFLYLRGRHDEALAELQEGTSAYAANPEWPVSQEHRRFAEALTTLIDQGNTAPSE